MLNTVLMSSHTWTVMWGVWLRAIEWTSLGKQKIIMRQLTSRILRGSLETKRAFSAVHDTLKHDSQHGKMLEWGWNCISQLSAIDEDLTQVYLIYGLWTCCIESSDLKFIKIWSSLNKPEQICLVLSELQVDLLTSYLTFYKKLLMSFEYFFYYSEGRID